MAQAPRTNKIATKIAYKVNGIPPNLQRVKPSKRDLWIEERLRMNENRLVR